MIECWFLREDLLRYSTLLLRLSLWLAWKLLLSPLRKETRASGEFSNRDREECSIFHLTILELFFKILGGLTRPKIEKFKTNCCFGNVLMSCFRPWPAGIFWEEKANGNWPWLKRDKAAWLFSKHESIALQEANITPYKPSYYESHVLVSDEWWRLWPPGFTGHQENCEPKN